MPLARAPELLDGWAPGDVKGHPPGERPTRLTSIVADTRRCDSRIGDEALSPRQMALLQSRASVLHVCSPEQSGRTVHVTFAGLRVASAPAPRPLLIIFAGHGGKWASPGVSSLVQALDLAVRNTPGNGRLIAHLALALRALVEDDAAPAAPVLSSGLSDAQLRRALAFMEMRYGTPLKLADMAAACALSPGHFARAFQASTGKTPYRWLLERRVAEARRLLTQTNTPLLQVALACGFASQSHFTRIFRNTVGMPPGVWRRSAGAFG